jgi:pimeloyl-ACP methyl ester carboxylesterase
MQTNVQASSRDDRPLQGAGEQHRQVRTNDGITIAYSTRGSGSITLLFMHGWGGAGSGHSWAEIFAYLDLTGLRTLVADLRGHGKSEQTAMGFTTERFAQDMFAVADDAGADRFIVVGYSMSGKWAQWMACTAPERIAGQILVAPVPAAEMPIPEEVKEQWLQMARSGDSELFKEVLRPFLKEPLSPELVNSYFYDVSHTSQVTLGATLEMMRKGSFVERLPATRAPTLVIGGSYDALVPLDTVRQAIVAPIPGARLAVLDCGHEVPLEQPQVAAALIQAFLAGLGR